MTPSVHAVATAASESARDAVVGEAASPERIPPAAAATEADAAAAGGATTGFGEGGMMRIVEDFVFVEEMVDSTDEERDEFSEIVSIDDFDSEFVALSKDV